ncbi:hypothetical protein ATCC90586_005858 [Pythium insidiosum]|nr:hypothetical protein ATCC90586_005858 [Pythium insidiosum]
MADSLARPRLADRYGQQQQEEEEEVAILAQDSIKRRDHKPSASESFTRPAFGRQGSLQPEDDHGASASQENECEQIGRRRATFRIQALKAGDIEAIDSDQDNDMSDEDDDHQQQQDDEDDVDDEDWPALTEDDGDDQALHWSQSPMHRRVTTALFPSLAAAYCERASFLLKHTNFDASVRVPAVLLECFEPLGQHSQGIRGDEDIAAVQQALEDALAAVAIDSQSATPLCLASQASRCLGRPREAMEFASRALQLTPYDSVLQSLVKELRVELDGTRLSIAPQLLCTRHPAKLTEIQFRKALETLEILAASPVLHKLETMMHHNIHHQCASAEEHKTLYSWLNQITVLLGSCLQDAQATSQAIFLEVRQLEDMARQLSSASALVENAGLRRWLVRTLAPAVKQSIPESFQLGRDIDGDDAFADALAPLLYDVLVVLTRLLLAIGGISRCTNVPHTLTYLKTAYDLAKQLVGDSTAGLLELTEDKYEALLMYQDSLQAAVQSRDELREMQCHHFLGRALAHLREYEVARTEFSHALAKSQELHDRGMECLVWYELGEVAMKQGDVDEAMTHFERALMLCNQTAHCHRTWREQSIQHAMTFYASMKKTRRRAITAHLADGWLGAMAGKASAVAPCASSPTKTEEYQRDGIPSRRGAIWLGEHAAIPIHDDSASQSLTNATPAVGQQVRGMATEKQILMRIGSTSSTAKITKSMKMVSAAKMRGAETRLNNGRPFAAWLDHVSSGKYRVIEKDGLIPKEDVDANENNVFVIVTSDRGLCGGINSGIAKASRKQLYSVDKNKSSLFIIGEKGRAQLRREFGEQIRGSATETYVNAPTFTVASAIAEAIVSSAKDDNEKVHVVFNKFVSAIAYQPSIRSLGVTADSEDFAAYEIEPDSEAEVLADLKEFEIATAVFHGLIENSTSEESSRMTAMENATNNAQDLISSLTLVYNKARQARITTELIEIISGASALDG